MSFQSDSAAAELLNLAQVLYQANYCILGATCFLIYDYVITFSREVNLFWTHKCTGASVLFFANRYVTLVWNIMGLAQLGQISQQVFPSDLDGCGQAVLIMRSCPVYYKVFSAISYSQYIIWAAFSGLRTYALSRSRILAIFLFVLAAVPAGINYAQFRFGLTGATDPDFGCFSTTDMTRDVATKCMLVIASRTCLITTDTILLVLTWVTLGRRDTVSKFNLKSRWSLSTIMLRDGILYFLCAPALQSCLASLTTSCTRVLLSLNVLHLAFTLSATFGHLISNIAIFEDQITAVLVSRFLLDLQTANQRSLKLNTNDPLYLSTDGFDGTGSVAFARVVGSLGEGFVGPISLGSDPEDDDFSDTYYWSGSTREDQQVEPADKTGRGSDVEVAMPAATVENRLDTDIEEISFAGANKFVE